MPDTSNEADRPKLQVGRARPAILAVAVLALAVGMLGVYGIAERGGKPSPHAGACAHSLDRAVSLDPLIHGEVAALTPATRPVDLASLHFDDPSGAPTTVAAFKGKTVLLNVWATWCVPCRAEMPALDKLQIALGSAHFEVVPVNIDTARLDRPRAFLSEIGATRLPYYSDKSADILQALKAAEGIEGLPTSILVGPDGCAIGTMAGPADWASPDAKALIEKASS